MKSRFAAVIGLGLILNSSILSAQTISERVREASRKPGTPVVIGILGEPMPLSVQELTKGSDLIVEARISRLKSRINLADTAVLTDFGLVPLRVLSGTLPDASVRPGVATPLVMTSYGGEVARDGVTVRAENHDLEPFRDGGIYLLFLTRSNDKTPGVYTLFNAAAFEIAGGVVRPLASQGADLFRDFSDSHDQVVARIMAAVRARSRHAGAKP